MNKFNPVGYLLGAGITTTPCCDRAIASLSSQNFSDGQTLTNGSGIIRCIQCDKPYTVTIEDSMITSITPVDELVA
jgi:hypothetical protein